MYDNYNIGGNYTKNINICHQLDIRLRFGLVNGIKENKKSTTKVKPTLKVEIIVQQAAKLVPIHARPTYQPSRFFEICISLEAFVSLSSMLAFRVLINPLVIVSSGVSTLVVSCPTKFSFTVPGALEWVGQSLPSIQTENYSSTTSQKGLQREF